MASIINDVTRNFFALLSLAAVCIYWTVRGACDNDNNERGDVEEKKRTRGAAEKALPLV